ncbi:TPA: cupin-like domain-containing protein [Staphylococcus delphini]|nr:cupin-like domain-containing protein [Staphylococcus delphini]
MEILKLHKSELSINRFFNEFYGKRPLIITGVIDDWKISGETLETFASKYGDRTVPVRGSNNENFKEFMEVNVRHYIENLQNNPDKWYCDFPTDFEEIPEIANEFFVPEYFNNNTTSIRNGNLYQWLYLGGAGTGTPLHRDIDHSHAWNALVFGEKEWIVFPEDSKISLYEKKIDLFENFEKKLQHEYIQFIQNPNELVYIPKDIWHQVRNNKDSLCITGNFWDK